MASRARKTTFAVIGGALGLVVLIVAGLLLWSALTPPGPADYRAAGTALAEVEELGDPALATMVRSVGDPAGADQDLETLIVETIGQTEILQDAVDDLSETAAVGRDRELGGLVDDIETAYDELGDQLEQWQEDGYAVLGSAAAICAHGSQEECVAARDDARSVDRSESTPMTTLHNGIERAASGSPGLDDALTEVRSATDAAWTAVTDAVAAARTHIDAHSG